MSLDSLFFSALFLVPTQVAAPIPDASPVVAAERAFAADRPLLGITDSFTRWSAPEAIVIMRGRVRPVREVYVPGTPRPADEPALDWWPTFAGMARSGDFGFTTGPMSLNGVRTGHYFTIWRRQADGGWKWIYDGGTGANADAAPGPDSEPVLLAMPDPGPGTSRTAMAEIAAVEQALARDAAVDQKAAHLAVLADDGRLYVGRRPPATGRAAFGDALSGWPSAMTFGPSQGGEASAAGDMVWTYGEAAWRQDGADRRGHYVRLWRSQADGWRLVLAQLIPAPPAAA